MSVVTLRNLLTAVLNNDASRLITHLEGMQVSQRQDILSRQEKFSNRTPLCEAVARGNLEVCRILLSFGANVNLKGVFRYYQYTPLEISVYRGDEEIFNLLINAGANIRAVCNNEFIHGHSLLAMAVYHNKIEIAKKLVSHGADPNYLYRRSDSDDGTKIKTRSCVEKRGALPVKDFFIICQAIDHKNMEMVQLLVNAGAIVRENTVRDNGSSIHWSAAVYAESKMLGYFGEYFLSIEAQRGCVSIREIRTDHKIGRAHYRYYMYQER
jgi:Ankyrin repeats (3 copies)